MHRILKRSSPPLTLGIDPIGVEVGYHSLVADLLKRLSWLVVDLENAARSPPPTTAGSVGTHKGHIGVCVCVCVCVCCVMTR